MLGESGAIVYCTGRSSRGASRRRLERPETIEETAEMVTAAGGNGIAVRVDHAADDEVAGLFERVKKESKRLDVLVNVFTGPPATWRDFLKESPAEGRRFVEVWFWPRVVTAWHAAALMAKRKSGLIVELVEQPRRWLPRRVLLRCDGDAPQADDLRSRARPRAERRLCRRRRPGIHAYGSHPRGLRGDRGQLARRAERSAGRRVRLGRLRDAVLRRSRGRRAGRRSTGQQRRAVASTPRESSPTSTDSRT